MNYNKKSDEERVVEILLEYKRKYENSLGNAFATNKDAEVLILTDWNAFLFAVIFDQQIKAGEAWNKPFELKKRLGHLDVNIIANMNDNKLYRIFSEPMALHRYKEKTANWIKSACKRLIKYYQGETENIWADTKDALKVIGRFDEFDGIGQKKSTMATNFLIDYFKMPLTGRENIDISVDVMIERVFKRVGLVSEIASTEDIIQKARELRPAFPGELDYPCWEIGSEWCTLTNPYCFDEEENCPLVSVCKSAQKGNK